MFASLRKIPTFATANAEIAQLVEHNLAKVGVASSSLVFVERHAGSSPVLGTKETNNLFFDKVENGEMAELVDALL